MQVVYIMGNSRSGSTILDTLLGNHPAIESVGELVNLPDHGWLANQYCACGSRARECVFWEQVRERWMSRTRLPGIDEYLRLQNRVGRYRRLLPGFHRPDTASVEFQRYADCTVALFESIGEVSGKSIVVDSSKIPLRAYLLSHIPQLDLKIIHLVRDARGVAWSLRKSFKADAHAGVQKDLQAQPVTQSVIEWMRINAQSTWVRARLAAGSSICLRYEDLMADPRGALARIGALAGCDFRDLAGRLEQGKPLAVGHTIAGNRMRMEGQARLRPDEEWRTKMSARDQWLIGSLAGWQMRRLR
jgi:hypothetical protein